MNIVNGDAAAGSFKQAFDMPVDELLVFRDVLSVGSIQKFNSITEWRETRQFFWNHIMKITGTDPQYFTDFSRDFYIDFEELLDSKEIHLWIGCALSDQLLLVFLVYLLHQHKINLNNLFIYQYTQTNNLKIAHGLGMLDPERIKQTPEKFNLTEQQTLECLNAWEAVTHHSPEQYLTIINSENSSLPMLNRALKALLFRYPNSDNGLSYIDEVILKNTTLHGPKASKIIGYTLGEDWHEDRIQGLDLVGDLYLYGRLQNMASPILTHPLLSLNKPNVSMKETELEILDFGLDVLNKKKNSIELNGIDDWVCGVHLNSLENLWYRNDTDLTLVKN